MQTKLLVTIIGIFILIAVAVLGVFFYLGSQTPQVVDLGETRNGNPIFPFGDTSAPVVNKPIKQNTDTGYTNDGLALQKISESPIAGAVIFNQGSTSITRYVERGTGHVYEKNLGEGASRRISNTTIPKIYEALWTSDGQNVVIRYLNDDTEAIRTFVAKFGKSTSTEAPPLEGVFLEESIKSLATLGKKIIYAVADQTSGRIFTVNPDGTKKTLLMSSPFGSWLVGGAASLGLIQSKPSAFAPSVVFTATLDGSKTTKLNGGAAGLSTLLNPLSTMALESQTGGGEVGLYIFDIKKSTLKKLPIATLAEKCTWSSAKKTLVYCAVPSYFPGGNYPDDWYQGSISFNDDIWSLDIETGETEVIFKPSSIGARADIVNILVDQRDHFLMFTSRDTNTLWSLDLTR